MCWGLGVYFSAPEPGVFLLFGVAYFHCAFPAVFFGVPRVSSHEVLGTSSIWTVSVRNVDIPGHAPEVGLIIGSSSPSNGLRLT